MTLPSASLMPGEQLSAENRRERPTAHACSAIVRIARSLPELEELRDSWNQWCDDPNADLELYLAWARRRPEFVRPHVMAVYREGRPDCMLLGRLERRRLPLKVGYLTLFMPRVRQLFFVRGGLLGTLSADNIRLLVRELKACLRRGEADLAEVPKVRPNLALDTYVTEEFNRFFRGHFAPLHEHRWLELPGSYEEFLKGLTRKDRHELRRHEKKVAEDFSGRTHIRCFRKAEEIGEMARDVEKISSKTYQRALGVGFHPDDETLESLRITSQQGGLRACVLYLDEQPSAYFIGRRYKSTLHGNFMGYDPQFGKYSPGLLILMHGIKDCFETDQRATEVDLGWGDRQYKRMVCNRTRQDGPIYLYAPSWKGLSVNFLRSGTSFLDSTARETLARSTFLQKVKKAWQERLQNSKQAKPFLQEQAE